MAQSPGVTWPQVVVVVLLAPGLLTLVAVVAHLGFGRGGSDEEPK